MESKRAREDDGDDGSSLADFDPVRHASSLSVEIIRTFSPEDYLCESLRDALGVLSNHRNREPVVDSSEVAASLHCVAACYARLGQFYEALRYSLEALQLRRSINSTASSSATVSNFVTALNAASAYFGCLGDLDAAVGHAREAAGALAGWTTSSRAGVVPMKPHNSTQDDDDDPQNVVYFVNSLEASCGLLFDTPQQLVPAVVVIPTLINIAHCFADLGNHSDALRVVLYVLALHRRGEVPAAVGDAPALAPPREAPTIMRLVGRCHLNAGNAQDGLKFGLRSLMLLLQMCETLSSPSATCDNIEDRYQLLADVAATVDVVGHCYDALGDVPTALACSQEALALRGKLMPGTHALLSASLNNVACSFAHSDNLREALQKFLEALRLRIAEPEAHPSLCVYLDNTARCYLQLGCKDQAVKYAQRAAELRCRILPLGHPDAKHCDIGCDAGAKACRFRRISIDRI